MTAQTLFVSWDGPGPNYFESLFMPIFAGLQKEGVARFDLMQYAWDADERSISVARTAETLGMPYTVREVWPGPQVLATGAMMVRGALEIARYARTHEINVIMPRSIIPAGMTLLALRVLPEVRLLYDADGLKADERADFGGWSREGTPYRVLSAIERTAIKRAEVVVTRTARAKEILAERAADPRIADRIVVISNGKDSRSFAPGTAGERLQTRARLDIPPDAPLVVYAGSLGEQYHPGRMIAFFQALLARRPDARLVVLTGKPEIGLSAVQAANIPRDTCVVKRVHPAEVPVHLAAADLGLAFREPSFSQQAVAPIKVGEYLLCGLPVFSSRDVGDLDGQLDASVARLTATLSDEALRQAARWFVDEVLPQRESFRRRCRRRGLDQFSLERTVAQYSEAFRLLSPEAELGNAG